MKKECSCKECSCKECSCKNPHYVYKTYSIYFNCYKQISDLKLLSLDKKYNKINNVVSLLQKNIKEKPLLNISIKYDEIYYIAECSEIPIYVTANSINGVIYNFKEELKHLYLELREDNNLSKEWLKYKKLLKKLYCEGSSGDNSI